jgi:aspartate/methionine/tyrosine aminotransferase
LTDFANRQEALQLEAAYEVMAQSQELASKGHDIIHLEAGEPDFSAPSNASLAGIRPLLQTRHDIPHQLA